MFRVSSLGGASHANHSDQATLKSMATVIQNAPYAMMLTDSQATILAWNPPALSALPKIADHPVLDVFRPWISQVANSDRPVNLQHGAIGAMTGWRVSDGLVMLQEIQNPEMAARLAELEKRQKTLETEAAKLRKLARNDHLTGLLNAASFAERCAAKVTAQRKGVLLYLDLDGFKPVNDTHGHRAGDHVLREVSDRLLATVRQEDLVARLGGDEFGIWLNHYRENALRDLIARLQAEIARPIFWQEEGRLAQTLRVNCSVGVAVSDGTATEFTGLLALADAAMYADKRKRSKSGVASRARGASEQGQVQVRKTATL